MPFLRRLLKGLFKLLVGLLIAAGVLFALVMGYFFYKDVTSKRGAEALCAQASPGTDAAALVARARADGIHVRDVTAKSRFDFTYGVPIRSAYVCRVTVAEGKITAATVKYERDGIED